jgi:hypothetical protein
VTQQAEKFDYGHYFGSITIKKLQDLVSEKNYLDDKLDVYAAAPEAPAVK